MNTENQKALLEYIRNMPEWQSALIYEQLASLNKAAADICTGTSTLEQGFADGRLRPDRYYCSDRFFRRDCNTGIFDMDLSAFLAENAIPPEEEAAFVVSKRFLSDETDKKGNRKPLQWKLKAITGAEDESLRKSCVKRVPVPGRRNQYQQETDYNLYLGKLAVACTVYPNLNDKALQDSYKVMGAENLLKTMLTSGEYAEYLQKVQEVCGFDVPLQDEVDDAKN